MGPHRHRADWIGFLCFSAMATVALLRAARAAALILAPAVLLDVITGVTFLTRRPLRRQATGVIPKACAFAASFGLALFILAAQKFHPQWLAFHSGHAMRVAGFFIWLFGTTAAVLIVWRLRHAFSVVPQARELVTTGPYRLARHPIYVCYFLQGVGYALLYWNVPVSLAVVGWQSIMLLRARFEEQLLLRSFPEYADYRRQVGMFFPRLRALSAPGAAAARVSAASASTDPRAA